MNDQNLLTRADEQKHWESLMTEELKNLIDMFRGFLYLPDPTPVLITIGTFVAHRMSGDPVWIFLVGPPSYGKTEILRTIKGVDGVHSVSEITQAGFMSGSGKRDKSKEATGGLLVKMGESGFMVFKDFTTVLESRPEVRNSVFAMLRELYDGYVNRNLGTDGGLELDWEGRIGIIAGVTDAIETVHEVAATMGERFIQYNMPEVDLEEFSRRSLESSFDTESKREDASKAVVDFLGDLEIPSEPQELSSAETDHLIALTDLVVRGRASVTRDPRTREVVQVPRQEGPARLLKVLHRLLEALFVIGVDRSHALEMVTTVGFDSIPSVRRRILNLLACDLDASLTLKELLEGQSFLSTKIRREVEELEAFKLVTSESRPGTDNLYRLSDLARKNFTTLRANLAFPQNHMPQDESSGDQLSRKITRPIKKMEDVSLRESTSRPAPPDRPRQRDAHRRQDTGSRTKRAGRPWNPFDGIGGE